MILTGVGKRYAVALFNAAENEGLAEQVNGDVTSFDVLFKENSAFRHFLLSPEVRIDEKRTVLTNVLGDRASGLFLKFLMLLIEKKRVAAFEEIADAYVHLWETSQDIVEAKVITAVPIDRETELEVTKRVARSTGKMVKLVKLVDPRIIGGMIAIIGDRLLDGSIRYQLERMNKDLKELQVH